LTTKVTLRMTIIPHYPSAIVHFVTIIHWHRGTTPFFFTVHKPDIFVVVARHELNNDTRKLGQRGSDAGVGNFIYVNIQSLCRSFKIFYRVRLSSIKLPDECGFGREVFRLRESDEHLILSHSCIRIYTCCGVETHVDIVFVGAHYFDNYIVPRHRLLVLTEAHEPSQKNRRL